MNTQRWQQVEHLYHAALELAPERRATFLDGACPPDPDLRREVESLLAQAEQDGSFLERSALEETATMTVRDALPGARFGAYRILSPLGSGGMGEVYRAHDSKLGRDVAIKTLPRAFASDPERLARFRREARMLASLNHPNIAAIYGLEESEGTICLVLELVEGENLRGPLPVDQALDYARQIAEALDAAHKKGVIHRDLKPANVKVTPEGKVKVLDFGLAKAISGTDYPPNLSQMPTASGVASLAGHIVGTPGYMSPEQARGQAVDKRTDIWAFGCLLYELLAGKRVFLGDTVADTIAAIVEREPDWQALPAKTPAKIRELLRQCLQKDAGRRLQDIAAARRVIEKVIARSHGRKRRQLIVAAAVALVVIAVAAEWTRGPTRPADRSEWVQITNFPDSVSQPALSPDGRMLAFIRGPETFVGPGQIYVKLLPDGEPVQLTRDDLSKMNPMFSPDGSRIAYTVNRALQWDTWVVPVLNGQARPWLTNASGLAWLDQRRLLFSEVKKDIHMGIVTAEETRAGARDVYLPTGERSMAHRSYPSPDAKSALVVEMDRGRWLPCRLVPIDGSSAGRPVGPQGAGCTFAAWSPDGRWMYFSSSSGGTFHTWRQRFPDGQPEQITSGLTEEEGITIAPDGRSLITSVALKQSVVWVHDARGERQVSLEGYSYDPKFTPDGKRLCYRILKGPAPMDAASELHVVELDTGDNEPLLPGLAISGPPGEAYDISPDGRQVVIAANDREGKRRLWLAALDRQSPPRQLPNVEGDMPVFGKDGEIFFRAVEGTSDAHAYRVREDGTGLQKMSEQAIGGTKGISQDGQWLAAKVAGEDGSTIMAFPVRGGSPVTIISARATSEQHLWWSLDGKRMFISTPTGYSSSSLSGRTFVVPLPPGRMLPPIPAGGFQSEAEIAKLPGARVIDAYDFAPGPTAEVYAFSRGTVQRNLYRIPIP